MRRVFGFRSLTAWAYAAALCSAQPAHAEIRNLFQFLQNGLGEAPQTVSESAQRKLLLNGFPLHMRIGRSQDVPGNVAEHFAQSCSRSAGSVSSIPPPLHRQQGRDYALVIGAQGNAAELWQKMRDTKQHYIFLAPLCMAYAHRSDDATDYMAVWSDAPLPPQVLSPSPGHDAPGTDAVGVPRPMGSTRLFSLVEPAAGYVIVSYSVSVPSDVALRETVSQLGQSGFTIDGHFGSAARDHGKMMIRMERSGQDVLISTQPLLSKGDGSQVMYLVRVR